MWRQSRSFCRPCSSESKRARDREKERKEREGNRESERAVPPWIGKADTRTKERRGGGEFNCSAI